jgi:hypothetical protein
MRPRPTQGCRADDDDGGTGAAAWNAACAALLGGVTGLVLRIPQILLLCSLIPTALIGALVEHVIGVGRMTNSVANSAGHHVRLSSCSVHVKPLRKLLKK